MTFQMKVLLYKNKAFIEKHQGYVVVDEHKKAEKRTKELLELSARLRGERAKNLDDEMESMLEALESDEAEDDEQDEQS